MFKKSDESMFSVEGGRQIAPHGCGKKFADP
jgi:hypothetical protein